MKILRVLLFIVTGPVIALACFATHFPVWVSVVFVVGVPLALGERKWFGIFPWRR